MHAFTRQLKINYRRKFKSKTENNEENFCFYLYNRVLADSTKYGIYSIDFMDDLKIEYIL